MSSTGFTILLIDYEPRAIEAISRVLEKDGYNVEVAQDGVSGMERFHQLRPDVTLVEAMIPRKHGFEVCQELKKTEHGAKTPILIMTGVYKGRKYRAQAEQNYGCDDYLEKPIAEELLRSTIHKFLENALPSQRDEVADDAADDANNGESGSTAGDSAATPAAAAPAASTAASGMAASPSALTESEIMHHLDAILPGDDRTVPAPQEAPDTPDTTEPSAAAAGPSTQSADETQAGATQIPPPVVAPPKKPDTPRELTEIDENEINDVLDAAFDEITAVQPPQNDDIDSNATVALSADQVEEMLKAPDDEAESVELIEDDVEDATDGGDTDERSAAEAADLPGFEPTRSDADDEAGDGADADGETLEGFETTAVPEDDAPSEEVSATVDEDGDIVLSTEPEEETNVDVAAKEDPEAADAGATEVEATEADAAEADADEADTGAQDDTGTIPGADEETAERLDAQPEGAEPVAAASPAVAETDATVEAPFAATVSDLPEAQVEAESHGVPAWVWMAAAGFLVAAIAGWFMLGSGSEPEESAVPESVAQRIEPRSAPATGAPEEPTGFGAIDGLDAGGEADTGSLTLGGAVDTAADRAGVSDDAAEAAPPRDTRRSATTPAPVKTQSQPEPSRSEPARVRTARPEPRETVAPPKAETPRPVRETTPTPVRDEPVAAAAETAEPVVTAPAVKSEPWLGADGGDDASSKPADVPETRVEEPADFGSTATSQPATPAVTPPKPEPARPQVKSPPPATTEPAPAPKPVDLTGQLFPLSQVDVHPQPRSRPLPGYTDRARRLQQHGTVELEALIDENGRVADVRVVREIRNSDLNERAVETVKTWRYAPAKKSGFAVRTWIPVQVKFRL